ncbi:SpoIIE family protein phosphatase [Streptomyces sp. NPDC051217]|uniref:SpoIIE family protein phosphatase n=1 Tax=Streptomyces sp. NPDC051217 TaxID=3365644 RepID=UPI0037B5FFB9
MASRSAPASAGYESFDLELAEGSLITLFTDGLIETHDADIDAGIDRLLDALRQAPADLDDLCSQVTARMTTSKPADDIALLIARTRASSS